MQNKKMRYLLTGELPQDTTGPVILGTFTDVREMGKVIKEYVEVFPEIEIKAEYGYFRPYISPAKRAALANLMNVLYGPSQKLSRTIAGLAG